MSLIKRCDGLGDMVDDTPTSKNATYVCSEPVDSCPHQPGLDPIHNIMGCKYLVDTYDGS